MITSLAVDRYYAYTLDTGVITRTQLTALGNQDTYAGPSGETVTQLATTNHALYVLCDSGKAFRRDSDTDDWYEISVPESTAQLSTSDHYLYALVAGKVWQRDLDLDGGNFTLIPQTIEVTTIGQMDHDEGFGYVLTDAGGVWTRKLPDQLWKRYPPLPSVAQVVAGLDFIYARTGDGNVWRSRTYGESGWEALNSDDVDLLAIASDHTDRLWMIRDGALDSVTIFDFGKPKDTAWVAADWVDEDWTEVV